MATIFEKVLVETPANKDASRRAAYFRFIIGNTQNQLNQSCSLWQERQETSPRGTRRASNRRVETIAATQHPTATAVIEATLSSLGNTFAGRWTWCFFPKLEDLWGHLVVTTHTRMIRATQAAKEVLHPVSTGHEQLTISEFV